MKIIICGDTHIGAVFGLGKNTKSGENTRVNDYENTLNYIADYAIESGADIFIQTGDAFEDRNPKPEHIAVWNRVIKKLSMANITTIIIMGNHDYRRAGELFTSAISSLAAKDYPNVRIVLEPEVIKLSNKSKDKVNLVLLPYRDRRMYSGKTVQEDSILYEKHIKSLIDTCNKSFPIISVGHNFYYTGSYHDYGGTEVLVGVNTFNDCDLIAMGHYHQFKILKKKNPIAIYTGSMEKINFGDENQDKYFIDYDTNTKKIKVKKVPSRSLKDITIDLSNCDHIDFEKQIIAEIKKYNIENAIVRAKVLVKDNLSPLIKKQYIEKQLYNHLAFYVSRINIESIITRIVRDYKILEHKDNFSIFKAFIDTQKNLDDNELELIISEAKKIMK